MTTTGTVVGTVESVWRYPVKSMGGEAVGEALLGYSGLYGDRCYAFRNSAAHKGFPYLTARLQQQMLLYRPHFRDPAGAAKPPNVSEAMSLGPGVTPINGDWCDLMIDVVTRQAQL